MKIYRYATGPGLSNNRVGLFYKNEEILELLMINATSYEYEESVFLEDGHWQEKLRAEYTVLDMKLSQRLGYVPETDTYIHLDRFCGRILKDEGIEKVSFYFHNNSIRPYALSKCAQDYIDAFIKETKLEVWG